MTLIVKIKCQPLDGIDIQDKIVVLKDGTLKKEYNTIQNHFYRATGGFGCSPGSMGRAVFTDEMFGSGKERWDRTAFAGWMTQEEFESFCEENNLAWKVLSNDNTVPNL